MSDSRAPPFRGRHFCDEIIVLCVRWYTIDFLLSPSRDTIAAKGFVRLAIAQAGGIQPCVINVDGHAAYSAAVDQLKQSR